MKYIILIYILLLTTRASFSQDVLSIDIQKEVKQKHADVIARKVTFINDPYSGIHLDDRYEDGIVWLKNVEFENGTIEADLRGKDIKSPSFVGIAFHGNDTTTYEAVYLRPFHFRAEQDPQKHRAVQYIARPAYTWQVLRAKFPTQYENELVPVLDPNGWVHLRIEVRGKTISAYINDNANPSLVVETLGAKKKGSVGFFVADTSGGDFANLKITKAK